VANALDRSAGGAGAAGIAGYERVESAVSTTSANKTVVANCPLGKMVLTGGYSLSGVESAQRQIKIAVNRAADADTWTVTAVEDQNVASWGLQTFAVCGNVLP